MTDKSFIELYLQYTEQTECPTFFHRWSAISALGAWLSRDLYFKFGHFTLYPNQYILLMGAAGTRKTTAIKIATKLFAKAGYTSFSAQKTRQEKFLLDLAEQQEAEVDILDRNLFGDSMDTEEAANCFVAADEFGNFIGAGNLDFMSILGELWDYEGTYKYRLKNSTSVIIHKPTISILGGITATEFNRVFPQEAIGQGFFSRLIIVHDEPNGARYTIPPVPCAISEQLLVDKLAAIKNVMQGELSISKDAYNVLDKIYHSWKDLPDSRFEHYSNRRSTHLIKLAMIIAASNVRMQIEKTDMIYANTILTMTEYLMPKALGEFGKGKNSAVAHKVLQVVDKADAPVPFSALWRSVHTDLDKREQLADIIQNLLAAEKLQQIGSEGYLPVKTIMTNGYTDTIDWTLLQPTEKRLLGV